MKTNIKENIYKPFERNGIMFNTIVISPAETITSLQIVCFFEFQKNQHYEGGTFAVNNRFNGEIHQVRKSGIFRGKTFETLLITPQKNQIPAHQLLLVGLGDPEAISNELFQMLGHLAVMEALKLGVKEFCFAPSLKDAGIDMSSKKIDVSKSLTQGMISATDAVINLSQKGMIKPIALTEVKLLAGKSQADNAYNGIKNAFEN